MPKSKVCYSGVDTTKALNYLTELISIKPLYEDGTQLKIENTH